MTKTKKIILIYALNYLALALAIRGHLIAALTVLLFGSVLAYYIIARNPMESYRGSVSFLTAFLQAAVLITGFGWYLEAGIPLLVTCGWLIIYDFIFPLLLQCCKSSQKTAILNACCLMFIALMGLLLAGDLLLKKVFGTFGILPVFWASSIIIGLPAVISSLIHLSSPLTARLNKKIS